MFNFKQPFWLLILLTLACGVSNGQSTVVDESFDPSTPLRSEEIVPVSGLVTGISFAPNGDMFYIVQRGSVYLKEAVDGSVHHDEAPFLLATIRVADGVENGLLGLALDPAFDDNGYLYIYYNVPDASGGPAGSRIERYSYTPHRLLDPTTIVDSLPASAEQKFHYGGGLQIGPDKKIYLIFGDRNMLPEARDPATVPGSILRYNLDGSIPEDNPFDASPVYAYGIRNGIGLAWNQTGQLYATENGADCDDELNLILPGLDYGWGSYPYDSCPYPDNVGQPPLLQWTPTISPVGLTFYYGRRMPEFDGGLMLCGFNESKLVHIALTDDGNEVESELDIFVAGRRELCRVAIAQGPGGWLYMANGRMIHRIGR